MIQTGADGSNQSGRLEGFLEIIHALIQAEALGGQVDGPRQYWRSLPREAGPIFGNITLGQR